jgi:mannonate dehydratase
MSSSDRGCRHEQQYQAAEPMTKNTSRHRSISQGRRRFIAGAGLAAVGAALTTASSRAHAGLSLSLREGVMNPCLGALPPDLAKHDLVTSAWSGLEPTLMWDCHAHLAGTGDSGRGITLNPAMQSLWHPLQYAQRLFFLNAGCADDAVPGHADASYVEHLKMLIDGLMPGVKLMLFALDQTYSERGVVDPARTAFYVPDEYARTVAAASPRHFEWVASIHPYRPNCVEALQAAARNGARAVKWLPAAQGMDPASPLCDRFYSALAHLGLPLISHAGEENAMSGSETERFGNPLRLRRALEHGVRVVVAHCASVGEDNDLDLGENGPLRPSFELFARMMNEARWQDYLFADISAVTQLNRSPAVLTTLLLRDDWHPRLLNGSDYPVPAVMPLFSAERMAELGFIDAKTASILAQIRRHNPLLFDFVLKRQLSHEGHRFPARVFETRQFFTRPPA